jgi:hypothetical protein
LTSEGYGLYSGVGLRLFAAVLTVFLGALPAAAESVEMTTYYPAPSGVYQKMTSNAMVLQPQNAAPATPVEGMIYFNAADSMMYVYSGGNWGRLLTFSGRVAGSSSLEADFHMTTSNRRALILRFHTNKRGMYSISWTGSVDIGAAGNMVSYVSVRFCGSTLIQKMTIDDEDNLLTTMENDPIDGSTMLQLAANTNYCIEMMGYKKGNDMQNLSLIRSGAELKVEELFAF